MNGRVCILTPDPASPDHQGRWRDAFAEVAAPLRAAALEVEGRSWVGAGDLAGFALVLPLFVWGYPQAHSLWLERIAEWEARQVRLMNPPSVLRWNSDKLYLTRLEARGAPVVPTWFADRLTPDLMEQAARRFGTDRLVAKPRISSSAWRTVRWSPGNPLDEGPQGAAMVQPYLPDIEGAGEASLIYFGRRFSHAVAKVPQPGDFRVQQEFDGIITAYQPRPEELAAAERVLAAVDEPLLYARVDLVRGSGGEPLLIELELVEPDLYLRHDREAGVRFAAAALELIAG
jgi:glutathione synthase/RimK-type ligase-like ATP-grasp enzyme